MLKTPIIALVAAVAVAGFAGASVAGEGGCIADWSEAAPIVKKEGLATVEELSAAARETLKGEIVTTKLCQENGTYVFRLVVRGDSGQLKSVTVDAKAPFGR